MITKDKLKEYIEEFPESMEIDDLIERLLFIEKIEKRLEMSENEESISENELKEAMEQWFKLNG